MAGYSEAETEKINEMLAEYTEAEMAETVMEVARLLHSQQEWRAAGCPEGRSIPNDIAGKQPQPLPTSATHKHRRRF